MARPLLIADVPWLLYRAFFALPESIVNASGRPVNALLGMVNALLAAMKAHPPRTVIACFGAEEATYRVELYSGYHANREQMPEALREQWQIAPSLLEALGWTVFHAGELEADDAIGAFAACEASACGRALLLSGDKDLYQAVGERVEVLNLKGKDGVTLTSEEDVIEMVGVPPALIPDLIALRGDPSDGITGAPGVGAKIAAQLLFQHHSLNGVIAAAEAEATGTTAGRTAAGAEAAAARGGAPPMRRKIAVSISEHAALLRTFKEIATLQQMEVELPVDRETDFAGGAVAARRLGMERLGAQLERLAAA